MDQIQTSSSSGGLLHFFFGREIAVKLQLKCSIPPATPDDACQVRARGSSREKMSTTHLVAISNQVRQRNECYKNFVKGFKFMLRKHSNKGMGKRCVKMATNDLKYFILLY